MILLLLLGCPPPIEGGPCFDAADHLGFMPCVHSLDSYEEFEAVSVPSPAVDQTVTTKYLIPLDQSTPITEGLIVDASRYELHQDFLAEAFPDTFSGITSESYSEMVLNTEERSFFSGDLTEYIDRDGETFLGFIVWDRAAEYETVTLDDVTFVWQELQAMAGFGDVAFVPRTANQLNASLNWDAPFPIRNVQEDVTYEAYTTGVGYGTIRRYSVTELEAATDNGEFGFQDILVLDEAPWDLEVIVSGLVTGSRQSTLSHLNVRSAARGTPNCYIKNPHDMLELYDGLLVRFSCEREIWRVEETTIEEAEAFWEGLRPEPVDIPEPDLVTDELVGLLDLPTANATQRADGVAAYGSKGANLATLYQRIDEDLQLKGFLVPMSAYAYFVTENGWLTEFEGDTTWLSFQETIDYWLSDDLFLNDTPTRRASLTSLTEAMLEGSVSQELMIAIGEQVVDIWGDDTTMVRFRSSSNAEDSLYFSGAGLYESARGCVADQFDGDEVGPSLCDSGKEEENRIEDALKIVWASLWNNSAYEEREWYGIDHSLAAMGVLVNSRSKGELVNIVAFSGDPVEDDDRTLINAQDGDYDVVSGEPGLTPEVVRLTISDGEVIEVDREAHSSLLENGWLLDLSQLEQLGEGLAEVVEVFPVDGDIESDNTLLLDTEWKVLEDGRLIVKQVRGFLR